MLRQPDLFREGWEERWPKLGTMADGTEIRADADITWDEYQTIITAGDQVKVGKRYATNQRYDVWQLRGHFGEAQVMRIWPAGR